LFVIEIRGKALGENCIFRTFTILTLSQILRKKFKGTWDRQSM
jgi:hypothetical protein